MGWEFIPLFLIAWFFQNCVHEGSHLFFAKRAGFKITGFYPYPHIFKRRLYFARSAWEGKRLAPGNDIMFAPVFGAVIVIMASVTMFSITNQLIFSFIICTFTCGSIDLLWWIRGYHFGSKYSDGKRFRYGDPK